MSPIPALPSSIMIQGLASGAYGIRERVGESWIRWNDEEFPTVADAQRHALRVLEQGELQLTSEERQAIRDEMRGGPALGLST